jgi:hypothetical protein
MMFHGFDLDLAIKDNGLCARQKISCNACPIPFFSLTNFSDNNRTTGGFCRWEEVYKKAILVKKYLKKQAFYDMISLL